MALYQNQFLINISKQWNNLSGNIKICQVLSKSNIQDSIRNSKERVSRRYFSNRIVVVNVLDYALKPNVDFNLLNIKNQRKTILVG
jgi:hypothetical protein